MKIAKTYCYKTIEIPANKMTRTFNALKRMNWVQNGDKGCSLNFACISDKLISKQTRSIGRYRQYTIDLNKKDHIVWIQNNQSVSWTIKFDNADEYKQWIDEHMVKIADFNF